MRGLAAGLVCGAAALSASKKSSSRRVVRSSVVEEREAANCEDCDSWSPYGANCKPCEDGSVKVNGQLLTSNKLRQVEVVDAAGDRQQLLSVLGGSSDPAVVVFLRHLGWPYCWDYANAWSQPQYTSSLRDAGVQGPIFISVAPQESAVEKMTKFLDLNPAVPRRNLFVDDSPDFDAYEAAGFAKIGDAKLLETAEGAMAAPPKLKPPKLGGVGGWWRYLTNVAALSPVPANLKFGEVPQGVLRLGGTFVIDGERVVFAHADTFPGDHPDISDVLRAANISLLELEQPLELGLEQQPGVEQQQEQELLLEDDQPTDAPP